MTWTPTIQSCDSYLDDRTGKYEFRAVRYRAAADWLTASGLTHDMTVVDVGAGMTELDYCLRAEYGWRGRYIPVDGGIDGVNLNAWTPPREAHPAQRGNLALVVARRVIFELNGECLRQTRVVCEDLYLKLIGGFRLEEIHQACGGRQPARRREFLYVRRQQMQ